MSVQVARLAAERLIDRFGIAGPPVDVEEIAASLDLRVVLG